MLLLLFLLLPHAAVAAMGGKCPDNSACLLFLTCPSSPVWSLDDVSKITVDESCNNGQKASYFWIAIHPQTARHWNLEISSSFDSLVGFTLFFGGDSLAFIDEASVDVTVDGNKKGYEVMSRPLNGDNTNENIHSRVELHNEKKFWLNGFDGKNISMTRAAGGAKPKPLHSFWKRLREKTPCYTEEIDDACKRVFGDCDKLVPTTWEVPCALTLWVNKGNEAAEDWEAMSSVKCIEAKWQASVVNSEEKEEAKEHELVCSSSSPVPCEPQEVKNLIDAGHDKFNVTSRKVTCSAKFWLSLEGSLSNDWQMVTQMVCFNGTWKWKTGKDEPFRPLLKQKLACSNEAQPQYKAAFYIVTIGCSGLIIAVIIVLIAICCCCRKGFQSQSRKSGKGELTSLGVKVNHKKMKMDKVWTWSREVRGDTSSNAASNNTPSSSNGEEEKNKSKKKRAKRSSEKEIRV